MDNLPDRIEQASEEPLILQLSEQRVYILLGAVNWMFGYFEGTGREVPRHVVEAFEPLHSLIPAALRAHGGEVR